MGNSNVQRHVCMVCAREMWAHEVEMHLVKDLQNQHVLLPSEPHPAHVLTNGMLLEREVLQCTDDSFQGDACNNCLRSLKNANVNGFNSFLFSAGCMSIGLVGWMGGNRAVIFDEG